MRKHLGTLGSACNVGNKLGLDNMLRVDLLDAIASLPQACFKVEVISNDSNHNTISNHKRPNIHFEDAISRDAVFIIVIGPVLCMCNIFSDQVGCNVPMRGIRHELIICMGQLLRLEQMIVLLVIIGERYQQQP